jgi:hypothetical protein
MAGPSRLFSVPESALYEGGVKVLSIQLLQLPVRQLLYWLALRWWQQPA